MTIVDLTAWKEEHSPYISGMAVCMTCGHRWAMVSPFGTVWFECPECLSEKAHYIYPCVRETPHWTCNCGNDLFYVTENGYYCPNCGEWQGGF